MKNFVIEYADWDSYNADSREEAVELFRKEHPSSEIIEVRE